MSKVLAVVRREVRHTVMTKAFLIAMVGVPVLMAVGIAVAVVMTATHREPPLVGTVVVIDADGAVAEAAARRFEQLAERSPAAAAAEAMQQAMAEAEDAGEAAAAAIAAGMESGPAMGGLARGEVRVAVEHRGVGSPPADAELAAAVPADLREAMARGELLAVAVIPAAVTAIDPATTAAGRWHLEAAESLPANHVATLESTLGEAIVDVRTTAAGVDPEELRSLLRRPRSETDRVGPDGSVRRESAAFREIRSNLVPMAFMMLLWIATFSSGTQLLHSTIEEKSNRVMEVLLSAISPFQLLTGKILGQGLVGLMFVGVYSAMGFAGLLALRSIGLVSTGQLLFFLVYFFMAYFMVATLMAAVGSAVSDLRDANSLLTPVMILLMIPLMLWMPISQAPNGIVATIMSFVPPAIPFVMILRVSAEEAVPTWQLIASILWGSGCTLGMVWAASRIFRVGVLMTGKPPSPMELIRWIRYA